MSGLVVSTPLNKQLVSSELDILNNADDVGFFGHKRHVLTRWALWMWFKGYAVRHAPAVVPGTAANSSVTGKPCRAG